MGAYLPCLCRGWDRRPTGTGKVETFNFNASEKQDLTVVISGFFLINLRCGERILPCPEVRFLIHIRPPSGELPGPPCLPRKTVKQTFSQTLQTAETPLCIHVNLLLHHTKILIMQLVWSEAFWRSGPLGKVPQEHPMCLLW